MQRSWPLAATNPEFSLVECPGYHEYRIENWRLARDGSGKVINGVSSLSWVDASLALALSYLWLKTTSLFFIPVLSAVLYYAWKKCSQVLSESIVVLPSLGVQLETRRGFPSFPKPLFTSRRFIPLRALQDVIINEGMHRWDIRYYLAFVEEKRPDNVCLEVAYENTLPYHDVLLHIYQGLKTQIPNPMTIRVIMK
ncbi:hypothetical protein M378DRAFT_69222 [Amanita muscaria Koide BX008]|uniref:Phosphatidylinositol N-acetylglucosaminyltransferase subunit H conserved domain-containing protein n=1 Tax=Amanita muscaria (strain Koide BX008) TaxID=946122 RepID=A0A0C2XKP7_AMAMK|nr:hypothetical protein M378DRAFT_69222 [Amanita muscaria Koide BX008]